MYGHLRSKEESFAPRHFRAGVLGAVVLLWGHLPLPEFWGHPGGSRLSPRGACEAAPSQRAHRKWRDMAPGQQERGDGEPAWVKGTGRGRAKLQDHPTHRGARSARNPSGFPSWHRAGHSSSTLVPSQPRRAPRRLSLFPSIQPFTTLFHSVQVQKTDPRGRAQGASAPLQPHGNGIRLPASHLKPGWASAPTGGGGERLGDHFASLPPKTQSARWQASE